MSLLLIEDRNGTHIGAVLFTSPYNEHLHVILPPPDPSPGNSDPRLPMLVFRLVHHSFLLKAGLTLFVEYPTLMEACPQGLEWEPDGGFNFTRFHSGIWSRMGWQSTKSWPQIDKRCSPAVPRKPDSRVPASSASPSQVPNRDHAKLRRQFSCRRGDPRGPLQRRLLYEPRW